MGSGCGWSLRCVRIAPNPDHGAGKSQRGSSHVSDFVSEDERSSLFNRQERSVWYLPRKPTLLYMYDVIARSQLLSRPKHWFILTPSGHWRIAWGYGMLILATVDVYVCTYSLAFCGAPYVGRGLLVVRLLFLLDLVLRLASAVPLPSGLLEFRPHRILRHHVLSGGVIVDLVCLLPLELALPRCWPNDWPTCHGGSASASAVGPAAGWEAAARNGSGLLSWQLLHILRWAARWRSCDTFRSVTSTLDDGPLQVIKYVVLVYLASHLSCCLYYWAAIGHDARGRSSNP